MNSKWGLNNLFKLGTVVGVHPPSEQLVLVLEKLRLVHLKGQIETPGYEPFDLTVAVSATQSPLGVSGVILS